MKLSVQSDRKYIRTTTFSRRYLSVEIQAPVVEQDFERPAVNISFVLDRSGSMGGDKIRLAKKAIEQGLLRLKESDYFSIVAYDDRIEVLTPCSPATQKSKREALAALKDIYPRGSTNLSGGWLTGCQQIAEHLQGDVLGRCFLLTDGLANKGIVQIPELTRHATELRKRGISTSTFGIGEDFNEELLGQMADAGGGSFTFIEEPRQIPQLINQELGETLEVVARDVTVVLSLASGMAAEVIGPYPIESHGNQHVVSLPDLISDQQLVFPVCLRFPTGEKGAELDIHVLLNDREGVLTGMSHHLQFTYANHKTNDKQDRNSDVDILVAQQYAAKAKEEASQFNRRGHFERAEYILRNVARKIRWYANGNPILLELIRNLEKTARRYRMPVDSLSLKQDYFSSTALSRGRMSDGRKKRSSSF